MNEVTAAGVGGGAELEASRELDALVAERFGFPMEPPCPRHHSTDDAERDSVLGWMGWCYTCGKSIRDVKPVARSYSTDIAAAWEIVEKMRERWGGRLAVKLIADPDGYSCDFVALTGHGLIGRAQNADTAPLAICRAALRAVTNQEENANG